MTTDTICVCGHWYEEHDDTALGEGPGPLASRPVTGSCAGCDAGGSLVFPPDHPFEYSADESTPEAIADRGGDPAYWPQWVKDHFAKEEVR